LLGVFDLGELKVKKQKGLFNFTGKKFCQLQKFVNFCQLQDWNQNSVVRILMPNLRLASFNLGHGLT